MTATRASDALPRASGGPGRSRARNWLADLAANGFAGKCFTIFGVLSSVAGVVQFALPDAGQRIAPGQWPTVLSTIGVVTLVAATVWARPRRSVAYAYRHHGTWTIRISRQDLYDCETPVVVTVDRLASTAPATVGPDSLVSGLVERWFGGDRQALENAIVNAGPRDILHPTGHTLAFAAGTRTGWLYCLADPAVPGARTSWLELAVGHHRLWSTLRPGNLEEIAVPVLGSGFARAQLSFDGLLSMLILSFHAASIQGLVTRTLHVCIRDEDFSTRILTAAGRQLRLLGYQRTDLPPETRSRSVSSS